tara:strand:- start:281 stop:967 length:687 start_codon:yes stop_codon:yes gene_type:complete
MSENDFCTTDLIQSIRDYQEHHRVLMEKSHHFVFDCPLNYDTKDCKPDYIFLGINPGSDASDWVRTNNKNAEETRDSNFQLDFSRSPNSKSRMTKLKNFLGQDTFNKTTHTELFFWCSNNIGMDFKKRYGHNYESSPYLEFCIKMNKKLIDRVNPKAIFLESESNIPLISKFFKLEVKKIHKTQTRKVTEYIFDNKYLLLNFDHLSAGPPASLERKDVSAIIKQIVNK